MTHRLYHFGLNDQATGKSLVGDGGQVMVCVAGSSARVPLYDPKTLLPATNPVSAVGGFFDFAVLEDVLSVDLYGISANGIAFVEKGVGGPDYSEFLVDGNDNSQVAIVPFNAADQAGDATETTTGLKLPVGALVSPFAAVNVADLDATETIDFGLLSSETAGDADGFGVAVSVAAAALVPLQSAATATRGALIGGATLDTGHPVNTGNAQTVSWTLSAGADTAGGFLIIPYTLS